MFLTSAILQGSGDLKSPTIAIVLANVVNFFLDPLFIFGLAGFPKMGTDGAAELKTLRDAGALTIAQDESSSLVHGMPGEAIRLGGAAEILSPVEIAHKIIEIVKPVK